MSALSKLSKMIPGSLHFQKAAIPALRVDGLITQQTYSQPQSALSTSRPSSKESPKIKIKSPF